MIGLFTAAEIRAAEEPVLAATPEGALMQRAATGLATVCAAAARQRVRTTGRPARGHRQQRWRRAVRRHLPRPARRPGLRRPARPRPCAHRRGCARCAGRAAGCCAADDAAPPSAAADLVLDGMLGIGGRGGLRPDAAELARLARRTRPALTVAVDLPSGIDADTGAVDGRRLPRHAHGHLRRGQARAGRGGGRGVRGRGPPRRHRPRPYLPPATAFRPHRRRRRRASRAAVGRRRQVLAGRGRRRRRVGDVPRRRACSARGRRCAPGPAWSGTPARPPTASARAWPEAIVTDGRPADAGRVQAWVVGPGMGTDDDAPRRAGRGARHRSAGGRRRRRADDAGRRAGPASATAAAPTLLTPHDREFARFGAEVGPDRIGAARRLAADLGCSRAAQGRRHGRRRTGRDGVRQRDRHALAGHRRHRRRPVRASPVQCWPTGLDADPGRGRGGPPARPDRSAGGRARAADRRAIWSAGCPRRSAGCAVSRPAAWDTRRREPAQRPARGDRRRPRRHRREHRACCARTVGRPLMAVVKADGYGHGLVPAARAVLAGGADYLGVAVLDEALALRAAGITAPLLAWLHGPGTDFAAGARRRRRALGRTPSWGAGRGGRRGARHRPPGPAAPVQGRHRALAAQGATPADWPGLVAAAARRAGRRRRRGRRAVEPHGLRRRTHAPARSRRRCACSRRRWRMARGAGLTDARLHLANSAATHRAARTPGTTSSARASRSTGSTRSAATPADLRTAPGDDRAGAGRADEAGACRLTGSPTGTPTSPSGETTLALVPVGYADGVPRAAGNRAPVLAAGAQRTIAGRVCMDQFVLDVGDAAVRAGRRGRPVGSGRPRRADGAAVGRRRRHHPLRAGHPGRRPVRPAVRRLGGCGLMAKNANARATAPHPAGIVGASSAWPQRAPPSGWPSRRWPGAGCARPSSPPRSSTPTEQTAAELREDDPLGPASRAADRTALVKTDDGVHLAVDEIGPAERAAHGRLRARLHALDGVLDVPAAGPSPPSWPPRTGTVRTPAWSSTTSADTARRAAGTAQNSTIEQLARDLAGRARGPGAARTGRPRRPLDGRHDDHGARGPAARSCSARRSSPPR